jgi:hypothetical protein
MVVFADIGTTLIVAVNELQVLCFGRQAALYAKRWG